MFMCLLSIFGFSFKYPAPVHNQRYNDDDQQHHIHQHARQPPGYE